MGAGGGGSHGAALRQGAWDAAPEKCSLEPIFREVGISQSLSNLYLSNLIYIPSLLLRAGWVGREE